MSKFSQVYFGRTIYNPSPFIQRTRHFKFLPDYVRTRTTKEATVLLIPTASQGSVIMDLNSIVHIHIQLENHSMNF